MAVVHFWQMTPWQLGVVLEAQADDAKARHELAMATAWHAAAFQRAKKMPSLREVLKPKISGKALDAKVLATMSQFRRKDDPR